MQDNPFAALVEGVRKISEEGRPAVYRLGVVTALTPLTIQAGDNPLTGKDLLVNADLLPRTRPVSLTGATAFSKLSGSLTGTDTDGPIDLAVSGGSLSGGESITGTLTEQAGSLAVGDQVVLLTTDDQLHIVLCKVVEV